MEPDHAEEPLDATPETPDNTESAAEAASGGKPDHVTRFLALFIDGIIASVLFWLLFSFIPGLYPGYILGVIVAGGYFLLRDGLNVDFMKGRSLGKKIMKLRPVRLDGQPMDLEASIKRNWMFIGGYLGMIPFLGTLGSLLGLVLGLVVLYECYKVLTDAQARRLGDELAGTKVIKSAA